MIETRSIVKLAQVGGKAQRLAQRFFNEQVTTSKADLLARKLYSLDRVQLHIQGARDWLTAQYLRIGMRDARRGWQKQAQRVGGGCDKVNA